MKRLIQIIGIALILNEACQSIDNGKVEATLSHKKIGESHLLVMTVKNNTSKPIYIPRLSCLMISKFDSIRIIDSKGRVVNDQFVENELQYGISFYGPPIDGKVITDSCSDEKCIGEEIELDLPPFTFGKKMIRSIIQCEYQNLLVASPPKMPAEEDIAFIKSLIFSKYFDSIFLKPKESFNYCITINTLFSGNETYRVYFHYTPSKEIEKYMYKFKFCGDSLEITSEPLKEFDGYNLYNETLKSDTLTINP